MGFRFRKSINLGGGFRINLSKTGIGYSFGCPGMRFTKLANGRERATFSIPGTGISYVEESSGNRNYSEPTNYNIQNENKPLLYQAQTDLSNYQDTNYDEFIRRINKCKLNNNLFNALLIIAIILCFVKIYFIVLPAILIIIKQYYIDYFRVTADFSFDEFYQDYFNDLNSLLYEMTQCDKVWVIKSKYREDDYKYNAGATSSVTRERVKLEQKCPPYLSMNTIPYSLTFEDKTFYFLPDRILLETFSSVKDIKYSELTLEFDYRRFIEDERVPRDSEVVDRTWRYVNKNGSPDLRFNNNYELPICHYSIMHCYSNSGLDILFHLSNSNIYSVMQSKYNQFMYKARTLLIK